MPTAQRPIVGISMGDPAGIGPEICAKALALKELYDNCRPIVVGDAGVMADAVRFCGLKLAVASRAKVSEADFVLGTLDVCDLKNLPGFSGSLTRSLTGITCIPSATSNGAGV